jgi:hypothetical protein
MVTAKAEDGKYPVIHVDLGKPVSGYWDGGAKQHFDFKPEPRSKHYTENTIKWGSYSANFFFSAKSGKSWADAASIAKRMIVKMLKIKDAKVTVEWRKD